MEFSYQKIKDETLFKGIGIGDIETNEFYAIFDFHGKPYFMNHIYYKQTEEGNVWDVKKSKVYHYTEPTHEDKPHVCTFCQYTYEEGEVFSEKLICEKLSREPFITSLWGACVYSEEFNETFEGLIEKINEITQNEK